MTEEEHRHHQGQIKQFQERREQQNKRFRDDENNFYEAGGWIEYRRLILSELERINGSLDDINAKIDEKVIEEVAKVKVELGMLQVKSGIWGALAGVLSAAMFIIIHLLGGLSKP